MKLIIYGLWVYNRVMHGYNSNTFNTASGCLETSKGAVIDLSRRELFLILPIMIGIFWLGLKPMA